MATTALQAAHAAGQALDFDAKLYAHADVKRALADAQHGKCAFCESRFEHVAYGDVEHFRPKRGWQQTRKAGLRRPGYYWLAYAWSNLLLSCQLCNQRHKGNLFPLLDPATRALTHTAPIDAEQPLFIDPASEDPSAHIAFRAEVPYAVNASRRGRLTIKELGLSRNPLNEQRAERLAIVTTMLETVEGTTAHRDDARLLELGRNARDWLRRAVLDTESYAAMTGCFLARAENRVVLDHWDAAEAQP